jgi:undecaprenyl-diphosphatase
LTEFLLVSSRGARCSSSTGWASIRRAPWSSGAAPRHAAKRGHRLRDIGIFSRRLYLGLLALGTVVTVALALPAKDWIEALTDAPYAPRVVGVALLITALWLVFADLRLRRAATQEEPTAAGAALIGVAQAIAVLPGISRSRRRSAQACCSASAASGRPSASCCRCRWSSARACSAGDLAAALSNGAVNALGLGLGFVAALLFGVLAIYVVLWLLKRARLSYFAAYCALLGVSALIIG